MSRVVPSAVLVVLLTGVHVKAWVSSQQPYVVTKDPQAVALAAKTLAAMGGAQVALSYQDAEATGTLTVYVSQKSSAYPITLKAKGTQESRVEVQKSNGINVRLFNQGQGIIQRPDGTSTYLFANNLLAERIDWVPVLSILSEYNNANTNALYLGTKQVQGQMDDVVEVDFVPSTDPIQAPKLATISKTLYYVNQSTGLIDKLQRSLYAEDDPNNPSLEEVYFGAYQSIAGIMVPLHQTIYIDGRLDSDILLSIVMLNVGLSDSEFSIPTAQVPQ